MFRSLAGAFGVVVLLATPVFVQVVGEDIIIGRRGDANHDLAVNISDIAFLSAYLFSGGDAPPCMNDADANGDGAVNGSDPIYLGNWLFSYGPPPPAPGPYATSCSEADPFISCDAGCGL